MTYSTALARLVEYGRQPQYSPHRSRMTKAGRNVDRRGIGERDNRSDSGHRHQLPADRIEPGLVTDLAVEFGELLAQLLSGSEQRLDDFRQIGSRFNELANPLIELECSNRADLQPKVAQKPTHIVFHGDSLFLQQLAGRQQGATLLTRERLHVHVLEQADPHHVRNAARIVAIALVRLLSLQERLCVPCLDTEYGESGLRQSLEQPLRQRPGFEPDPFKVECGVAQDGDQIVRVRYHLLLPADISAFIDNAYARFFDRDVETRIILHAALHLSDAVWLFRSDHVLSSA